MPAGPETPPPEEAEPSEQEIVLIQKQSEIAVEK
jgi:hypothetical protein